MRIRLAIPDRFASKDVLDAVLEATTRANHAMIEAGESPTATEAISGGAKWRPESFTDGEHFDLGSVVAKRGWGDCDDLAPMLAGELRATGQDPGALSIVKRSGPNRWHAIVQTSDGQILDPSRWAGMGRKSAASSQGIVGAITSPMCLAGEAGMAVQRHGRGYAARCDLPWPDSDAHVASVYRGRTAEDALHRAVMGAVLCGDASGCLHGELAEQIVGELVGDLEEVGDLFGSLSSLVSKAVPIAANVVAPGSGSLLSSLAQGGGGEGSPAPGAPGMVHHRLPGGSGTLAYSPYGPGPVIVRF